MARPHDEIQETQTWKTCRNSRQKHTEEIMTTIDLMTQMSWVDPTRADSCAEGEMRLLR